MAVIDEALNYRLIAMTFDELTWTSTISHLIASDDGIHWVDLKQYDFGWRDASLQYYKGWFYIIYTGGIERTNDFENFQNMGWPIGADGKKTWAPEWFVDNDGSWKIIYTQTTKGIDESSFQPYWCDYDPDTNTVSNLLTPIKVTLQTQACIDLNLTVRDGSYYLWLRDDDRVIRMYRSDQFCGDYALVDTNFPVIQKNFLDEGPEMVILDDDTAILYTDPWNSSGYVRSLNYSIARNGDLKQWSSMNRIQGLSFNPRHFGVYDFGQTNVYKLIIRVNLIMARLNNYYHRMYEMGYLDTDVAYTGFELKFDTTEYDQKFRNSVINMLECIYQEVNTFISLLKQKNMCDVQGAYVQNISSTSLLEELSIINFLNVFDDNITKLNQSLEEASQLLEIYGIGGNNDGS